MSDKGALQVLTGSHGRPAQVCIRLKNNVYRTTEQPNGLNGSDGRRITADVVALRVEKNSHVVDAPVHGKSTTALTTCERHKPKSAFKKQRADCLERSECKL